MSRQSQSEFAKAQGWNRSTVTRLKQAGRIVMDGRMVDVEASLARIAETGGMRDDVAERHATERAQKTAATGCEGAGMGAADVGEKTAQATDALGWRRETRADAQARKESALADLAEMEVRQKRGELAPVALIEEVLAATAARVAGIFDAIPGLVRRRVPRLSHEELDLIAAEIARARNLVAAMSLDDLVTGTDSSNVCTPTPPEKP